MKFFVWVILSRIAGKVKCHSISGTYLGSQFSRVCANDELDCYGDAFESFLEGKAITDGYFEVTGYVTIKSSTDMWGEYNSWVDDHDLHAKLLSMECVVELCDIIGEYLDFTLLRVDTRNDELGIKYLEEVTLESAKKANPKKFFRGRRLNIKPPKSEVKEALYG